MKLPEDDAWAAATAWQHELRGRVQLVVDPAAVRSFDIVKSHEWILVNLTRRRDDPDDTDATRLHLAACLRASCTLWTALARCYGYSGVENPSFWRRVFKTLDTEADYRGAPSADAFGFFDRDPERAFPRVLVSMGDVLMPATSHPLINERTIRAMPSINFLEGVERTVRVLAGLASYADEDVERSARLESLLSRLEPYCRNAKQNLPLLPLGVQVNSPQHAAQLVEIVEAITNSSGSICSFEKLVVNEWNWREPSATLHTLATLLQIPRISVPTISLPPRRDDTDRFRELQLICGLDASTSSPSVGHTSELVISRGTLDDKEMRAVLSALPCSRRIDTLSFVPSPRMVRDLTDFDWAWLGYAVFHPGAATSSWRRLSLDIQGIGAAKIDNFRRMQFGNNLLAALPGDWGSYPRTSDVYHTATLGRNAAVYAKSPPISGRELTRLPAYTTIDICVPSCDLTALPDFVCVIVPGLGLGWINKQTITEVTAWPPMSAPALSQLKLTSIVSEPGLLDSLLAVLRTMGPSLLYLGIRPCGYVDQHILLALLSCCPKLTSLAVTHDGSLWSEESIMTPEDHLAMPRLTHLELNWRYAEFLVPSQSSLETVLHDLQALRIMPSVETGASCGAVGSFLTRHYGLRYFHWQKSEPESSATQNNDEESTSMALNKMLAELKESSIERLTHWLGPLPVRQRAAVLSVVQKTNDELQGDGHTTAPPVLAALDQDILERVFSFASMPVERQLCFDGKFP